MLLAIGIIASVAITFFAGFVSVGGGGYSVQGNDNVEGCTNACANLRSKRAQVCSARTALASAIATRDSYSALLVRALATAALLLAASIAAALIPIFGGAIAASLATAYATAQAYVVFVLGQLAGAAANVGLQMKGLSEATRLENEAMDIVRNSCPAAEADMCINSLPSCP